MPHETPPSEEQPKAGISRRKFVTAAAAGTAGALVGTLALLKREKIGEAIGIGPLADVRKEYKEKSEALRAEYERTGELPDFAKRKELIQLAELERYMERSSNSQRIAPAEFKSRYDAFYQAVFDDVAAEAGNMPPEVPQSAALGALLKLKAAFQKHAGTVYNRDHDALPDPLLEKRYQCSSGTLALHMLTLQTSEQEDLFQGGETLVSVCTTGHIQPGLILKDGTLVTVEMTSAGSGVRSFGKMTDIKKPIRVVRADHGTFQEALKTDVHRDKAILYETVRDTRPPEKGTMPRLGIFGFGEPRVPAGDISMSNANVLPADDVFDEARLFNRMERKESEEELLQKIPNAQEREYVRNYMVHHRTVIQYYNAYVVRFNEVENITQGNEDKRVSLQTFLAAEQEIGRLAGALDAYASANHLDDHYLRTQEILA